MTRFQFLYITAQNKFDGYTKVSCIKNVACENAKLTLCLPKGYRTRRGNIFDALPSEIIAAVRGFNSFSTCAGVGLKNRWSAKSRSSGPSPSFEFHFFLLLTFRHSWKCFARQPWQWDLEADVVRTRGRQGSAPRSPRPIVHHGHHAMYNTERQLWASDAVVQIFSLDIIRGCAR